MRIFAQWLKSESMDSTLRSYQLELSGSLSRPYRTDYDLFDTKVQHFLLVFYAASLGFVTDSSYICMIMRECMKS